MEVSNKAELWTARLISILLHPVFIPMFACLYLVYTHPGNYDDYAERTLSVSLIVILVLTVLFPVLTLLIMRGLGLIQSLELKERKERIIPFVAISSFYVWLFMTLKPSSGEEVLPIFVKDSLMASVLLGTTISVFLAFIINVFIKISLHSMGAGALLCLVISTASSSERDVSWFLVLVVFLAGLSGTSRLILSAHDKREVYWGYLAGFLAMFAGMKAYALFYS